jgi:hypothetical protein
MTGHKVLNKHVRRIQLINIVSTVILIGSVVRTIRYRVVIRRIAMAIEDWLPPLAAAITFTGLGLAKVYGLFHGIHGGGCKPAKDRACGTCPSWSRSANLAFIVLLLTVGLGNFAILYMAVTRRPY